MRLTLIRLLLFAIFYLLLVYAFTIADALLWAFIAAWVFEPVISEKLK